MKVLSPMQRYMKKFGVSRRVISNITVERLDRMTEDAQRVIMNDLKRQNAGRVKAAKRRRAA